MKTRYLGWIAATLMVCAAAVPFAQAGNPRIGKWKLKQDAPPPALNIMTYEAFGDGGMKVTVEATNGEGRKSTWTYNTMLDGRDMPVSGDTRTEMTAVKKVDAHTNEITNKRGGKVTQVIVNVLSADGRTIDNTYRNYDAAGTLTSTTKAIYERIQ